MSDTKIRCKAIVTNKLGEVLLHKVDQNHPNEKVRGKYQLLGGNLEEGEDIAEGLKREIEEEVKVSPSNIEFMTQVQTQKGTVHHVYMVKLTDAEVEQIQLGDEGEEVRFFSFDEIMELKAESKISSSFSEVLDAIQDTLREDLNAIKAEHEDNESGYGRAWSR